jgi:hypothetical protein
VREIAAALVLTCTAAAALGDAPAIEVVNDAGVAPAEIDSIVADFRLWAARLYDYHGVTPKPVTLKLTKQVPFGFYRDGTVLLPPSADRQAMLEDWVHELTHHALGRDSSFFFREGAATHTVEALFARERMVPRGWPYFGRSCDAWVALFEQRGARLPLREALSWPGYLRGKDFESWQVYLAGCSFIGWYRQQHGPAGFRAAFDAAAPAGDLARLEKDWLAAVRARRPPAFDPAATLPATRRYRAYADRLKER